ncbi:PH domain-containing protein [Virgibacillus sp. MSP4-1]|uniref:PH domain-containing protein n=1 Tax=Virgibacillus sp. MSP4-1 TaxID=2700081 RepID=UPI0003A1505B|nr:PH domain-containing protein [Virgibacillus sp. MSP4-1]QHS23992.1 PH domain-containing protein [Virgibacillus sp. MSP4-1]
MKPIQEPENQISKDAVKVWRLSSLIEEGIGLIIITGLLIAGLNFDWYHWIILIFQILIVIAPFSIIWSIWMRPVYLQKYWCYGINEEFIQLKFGLLKQKHIMIPMTKVQFVEAEQGPLLRKFNLYTLNIGTIRSSHSIPALYKQEAFALRDEIAQNAKIKEVISDDTNTNAST